MLGSSVRRTVATLRSGTTKASAFRTYSRTCVVMGEPATPITVDKITGFAYVYVDGCPEEGLAQHKSSSLPNVVSRLITYAAAQRLLEPGFYWSPVERRATIDAIQRAYPADARRAAAVFEEDIVDVIHRSVEGIVHKIDQGKPIANEEQQRYQMYMMVRVCVAGGLRCSEIMRSNMRACHVDIVRPSPGCHHGGVVFHKLLPKERKKSTEPVSIMTFEHPQSPSLIVDLHRYGKLMGLTLGSKGGDTRDLFPRVPHRKGASGPWTYGTWIPACRNFLTSCGITDAHRYTGHSPRRFRRTQQAAQGLPRDFTMRAMGWASDAIDLYDARNPEQLCRQYAALVRSRPLKIGGKAGFSH